MSSDPRHPVASTVTAGGSMGSRQDLRLVGPAVAAWAAAWLLTAAGRATSITAAVGLLGITLLSAAAAARCWRRGHPATSAWCRGALVVAACAMVSWPVAAGHVARERSGLPRAAAGGLVVEIEAIVTADPSPVRPDPQAPAWRSDEKGRRWVVRLSTRRVTVRSSSSRERVPVLLVGDERWSHLEVGQAVSLTARPRPTGGGDSAAAMLSPVGGPRQVRAAGWWWRAAEPFREGLRHTVPPPPSSGPTDAAGLLPGLVVGDTSAVPADLDEAMRQVGLTHLTAVSGANLAIVASVVLALLGGRRPLLRAGAAGAAVSAFVVLARPEPSVQRAAAMTAVGLIALARGRRPAGVPALSTGVLVLLVLDPWLSRSFGFALSAAATGGLLVLGPRIVRRFSARLPGPLAVALAAPVAAQIACTPVLLLLNPGISLASVPANLLAEPAVAPATVVGLAAAVVSPVSASLAGVIAWPALWCCRWVGFVARSLAMVPGGTLPWPGGRAGAAAAVTASVVVALVLRRRRRRGPARGSPRSPSPQPWGARARSVLSRRAPAGPRPLPRAALLPLSALVAIAGTSGWAGVSWVSGLGTGAWPAPGWVAVQCDVGQGASLIVRTGHGRAAVLDAGPEPDLVDGCLSRLSVRTVDLLVLSHDHSDHVAGTPGVLRGRTVDTVLVSAAPAQPGVGTAMRTQLARAGLRPLPAVAGASGTLGGGVTWTVLDSRSQAPGRSSVSEGEGSDVNDSSAAVRLVVPGDPPLVIYDLGDLEISGQSALLRSLGQSVEAVDVVEVAHHGSARQVPALYTALRPRIALFGVGPNDYGHPTASALRMVSMAGAAVGRTDLMGDVAVVRSGTGLRLVGRGDGSGVRALPVVGRWGLAGWPHAAPLSSGPPGTRRGARRSGDRCTPGAAHRARGVPRRTRSRQRRRRRASGGRRGPPGASRRRHG